MYKFYNLNIKGVNAINYSGMFLYGWFVLSLLSCSGKSEKEQGPNPIHLMICTVDSAYYELYLDANNYMVFDGKTGNIDTIVDSTFHGVANSATRLNRLMQRNLNDWKVHVEQEILQRGDKVKELRWVDVQNPNQSYEGVIAHCSKRMREMGCGEPSSGNTSEGSGKIKPEGLVKKKPRHISYDSGYWSSHSFSALQDSVVDFATSFLGTPYRTAGQDENGFDCSGYVYFVFQHFNVTVPRSSRYYRNFGVEVPIEHVQKGDVLVFLSPTRNEIGHVGIVSKAEGRKSEFLHATSGKKKQVVVTNLKSRSYKKRFVKAVRVLPVQTRQ
jgi:hypothetical protein